VHVEKEKIKGISSADEEPFVVDDAFAYEMEIQKAGVAVVGAVR